MIPRRARDPELLDLVDQCPRTTYRGTVWRVVRVGRDPTQFSRVGGRWNVRETDALYTSLDANGAAAEIHFRWWQVEPVPPSRVQVMLHELTIEINDVIRFNSMKELASLGVDLSAYETLSYDRTQAIGDAAKFLGVRALIAPNARWSFLNLVVYELQDNDYLERRHEQTVDWDRWRTETRMIRRSTRLRD
jgi:hypothetical protein